MRALLFAGLAAAAVAAYAGEDSTHSWGEGGTGPNFWDTPCGLAGFAAAAPGERPCTQPLAAHMSVDEMRAWITRHQKAMDEMMARMDADHRAMMGSSGHGAAPAGGAAR